MMVGGGSRWGKRCGRSVFGGRPPAGGGSGTSGACRGASVTEGLSRAWTGWGSGGLQGVVAELSEGVTAALAQLARDSQTRAVATEAFGGLVVVGAVGAGRAPRDLGGFIERPAQHWRPLARQVPGRAATV